MASTGKKWFIGCGIGCGLFLLISTGIGLSGYFAIKKVVNRTEAISATYEAVAETFGTPENFVPQANGAIPANRVEVFLEVRRSMTPAREAFSRILFVLQGEMDGYESSGASKLELFKAGIGMLPALFDFMESRNVAYVEEGMGQGEYQYIYSMAYYGLLQKDPGDGPAFVVTGNERDEVDHKGFRWNVGNASHDEGLSRQDRAESVRDHLNNVLGAVLHNQLTALRSSGVSEDDPVLVALAQEIAAMDKESNRLIWEEGLPEQIRVSLAPFAEELDELYDPMMNAVEIVGSDDD